MDDRDVKQPPAFSRRDAPEGSSGFPSNRSRGERGMERREALYRFTPRRDARLAGTLASQRSIAAFWRAPPGTSR
jgi:hypothetical protein